MTPSQYNERINVSELVSLKTTSGGVNITWATLMV